MVLTEAMTDGSWQTEEIGRNATRFLQHMRGSRDASPRTIEDYQSVLARFAADHASLGMVDLSGARGADLVELFVDRHWGSLTAGTRRKVLAILSSFFKWAARMDRIASNPMDKIDRPRRRRAVRYSHSIEKVRGIIDSQPDLRSRVALSLMARLALRKNEMRLLRWRDVDLERGELRVHAKGGNVVLIPVGYADLLAQLAQLALEAPARPGEYLLYPQRWGNVRGNAALRGVVCEHRDRPMQASTMHRWWKRCLEAGGAADMPMHELRHHAGDEFRRAGNDLELTRLFMRHASITTTSDYYMHADRAELVAAMGRAGERWNTERGK